MAILSIALALQIQVVGMAATAAPFAESDSLRDADRAHDAQAWFERHRRNLLPWGMGGDGRCDTRIGRFCWWYDDGTTEIPPEPDAVTQSRAELLSRLDPIGRRHPGDAWTNGMRVHYHLEAHELSAADSAARECRTDTWWCHAIAGYAAHRRGAHGEADSAFARAVALMPDTVACRWRDIAALLPDEVKQRYEKQDCAARAATERRYWLLSALRLGAGGNEWRAEFESRRVLAELVSHAVTPHPLPWGDDATELLLRFGWPVGWSRVQPSLADPAAFTVVGHDPTPSFAMSARAELLADSVSAADDDWNPRDRAAPARYAAADVDRVVPLGAQVARFARGDSTLVVAAFATTDDSLRAPGALLAVADDRHVTLSPRVAAPAGRAQVTVAGMPWLAGVEVTDSASRTLARSRHVFGTPSAAPRTMSDLLLFRGEPDGVATVDEALARAIPGDTVSRVQPVGVFWESYGDAADTAARDLSILVERVDHGFFRGMRQRLGLADPDSPIRVHWSEPRNGGAARSARALSLDLSSLEPGRYRITVAAADAAGAPQLATREVSLQER